jgi:hypothetical protein
MQAFRSSSRLEGTGARGRSAPPAAVQRPRAPSASAHARRDRASAPAHPAADSAPGTQGSTPAVPLRAPPASLAACFPLPLLRSSDRSGPSPWLRSTTSGGNPRPPLVTFGATLCARSVLLPAAYCDAPPASRRHVQTEGGVAVIATSSPRPDTPRHGTCSRRSHRHGARYSISSSQCVMGTCTSGSAIPSRSRSTADTLHPMESKR